MVSIIETEGRREDGTKLTAEVFLRAINKLKKSLEMILCYH